MAAHSQTCFLASETVPLVGWTRLPTSSPSPQSCSSKEDDLDTRRPRYEKDDSGTQASLLEESDSDTSIPHEHGRKRRDSTNESREAGREEASSNDDEERPPKRPRLIDEGGENIPGPRSLSDVESVDDDSDYGLVVEFPEADAPAMSRVPRARDDFSPAFPIRRFSEFARVEEGEEIENGGRAGGAGAEIEEDANGDDDLEHEGMLGIDEPPGEFRDDVSSEHSVPLGTALPEPFASELNPGPPVDDEALSYISMVEDSFRLLPGGPPPRKKKRSAPGAQRVQAQDFFDWGVRADIVSLHQGTFRGGELACLVVFEVHFAFPRAIGNRARLREAKVTATFRPQKDERASSVVGPDGYPVVRTVCPRLIEGPVSVAKHSTGVEVTASIGGPDVLPVRPEASVSRSWAVETQRAYKTQLSGARWSSKEIKTSGVDNRAVWNILENTALAEGVPVDFRCAVVLEHRGAPVCGSVKITANMDYMGMKVLGHGWPWSDARPFVLQPSDTFGAPLAEGDLSGLDDEYWSEACRFDGPISRVQWT